jgi:asparagine synthase (glutamine-hydrolysing)
MCGITGFTGARDGMQDIIASMHGAIAHRGPDSTGSWVDEINGIALGHQRLAIQDLSDAGHQPMRSPSNRFVIIFNGEIYNHFDLRDSLERCSSSPISWNGHSDTETLATSIDLIGIQETLFLLKGMFALAVWDAQSNILTLARDRIGEKPLFYGFSNSNLVFGSELKAIKKFPDFNSEISKEALVSFFKYNYIPAPASIYEDIYKLLPGHFIQFNIKDGVNQLQKSEPYWSYSKVLQLAQSTQFTKVKEAHESLEKSLESAVNSQVISDVPLGAFLSGGVDSSLVVALMQKNSMNPTKTFTIGFKDSDHNEAPYAKAVANHLKTDHQELILDESDAMNAILRMPEIYDEPFADSSQIPTYLVSKMTREHVTVALSGDGGDELFGGYNRYTHTPGIWAKLKLIPFPLRKILGKSLLSLSTESYDSLEKIFTKSSIPQFGGKIHKMGDRMQRVNSLQELCVDLSTIWSHPNSLVKGMEENRHKNFSASSHGLDFVSSEVSQMMALDALTYLPDDILCKVDRAAMAVSLETRVPMLDLDVIESAARIPLQMKIHGQTGKIPLRAILSKYVPDHLINRPKAGFSIPIGDWLRNGPLRNWAESLLDESTIQKRGLLNFEPIQEMWLEHLSGKQDWTPKLWGILMFQAWLQGIESNNGES